ncbi:MAG: glycosyltransferase family 4 protein, partial [Actinomycetota bacterium]|nr:glycosyltransferase family 4 protein [Actinomycetota bacterium]
MSRALMVTSSFLPGRGGIESYLAKLCEELAPFLTAFAAATREGRGLPSDLPYATVGYPGNMLVPHRRLANAIESEARRLSVDRVLFGTPWPLVLLGPRLRRAGLAYASIIHGAELLVPSAIPGFSGKLAASLSQTDHLFAVSDFTGTKTRAFLENAGVRVPPIDLLRARVDLMRFHPKRADPTLKRRLGLREDQPIVLCFGRLVPRKGVDRLVKIAGRLDEAVPGAAVVIAGTGPQERRLRRVAQRSRGHIVFTGRVSEEDAPALFASADVFALPVTERWSGLDVEGLGVVLLEAAAAG